MQAVGPTGGGSLNLGGLANEPNIDPTQDRIPFRDTSADADKSIIPRDLMAALASRIVTANGVIVIANGAVVVF